MRRQDFHYTLPTELIAQQPMPERRGSRLLVLEGMDGHLTDSQFSQLPEYLRAGDLLVFNNTRVLKARLFGRKATGGRIEILIERLLSEDLALAHIRASKPPASGMSLYLEGGDSVLEVESREGDLYQVRSVGEPLMAILEQCGHLPLPPYIQRPDQATDFERYQTVYAKQPGAVAAPTAGLHFDDAMLEQIERLGVQIAYLTLHVGAGTFQPVRSDDIRQHHMHSEHVIVPEEVSTAIRETRARGGRVIAVGTTVVRALESAANEAGEVLPFCGDTQIFIYPGYRFRVIDAMITNFHLPESTLLMLVCAFAGYEHVMQAYQHAVLQGYRFFSYGDAMFVTKALHA